MMTLVSVLGAFFLVLVVLMAGLQRHLIYHPSRAPEKELLGLARARGLEPWRAGDGSLVGWRSVEPAEDEASADVVVFHGNAGQSLDRSYYLDGFRAASEGRWRVHLFEYPGYGARDGRPSERSIYRAARRAVEQLLAESDRPVYLVGESLGSGAATRMAAECPDRIAGLLLVTPFTRLADVAAVHFPFLPVRRLLRERYDNVAALRRYDGPVAVLIAGRDEVVTARLGKELVESYDGPVRRWVQEESTHNALDLSPRAPWWREMRDFFRENGNSLRKPPDSKE